MNASIREMPVTMSAFSMGILVIPMITVRGSARMLLMATEAAVPMIVAARADTNAISRVVYSALIMGRLSNICTYQSRVNPPHWVLDLERLKERTIMVKIGAYKKTRMITI